MLIRDGEEFGVCLVGECQPGQRGVANEAYRGNV